MRKRAELSIVAAEAEIVRLRDLVAASRVDAEMLGEKLILLREQLVTSQAALAQLADWIELGEPVLLADGNRWQLSDLQNYARAQMEQHKLLQANLEVYEQAVALHQQTAERAYAQLQTAQQNVANMYAKLDLLNAQLQLLSNLQRQSAFHESPVAVVALDQAGTLIDDLLEEVERETRVAEERNGLVAAEVGELPPVGEESRDALIGELRELAGLAR